jgi:hypothetical protein
MKQKSPNFFKSTHATILSLCLIALLCTEQSLHGINRSMPQTMTYYVYIADFVQSFIQIPTSNVFVDSPIIGSSYYAGRAPLYNSATNMTAGICSASFLNMQTADNIFTDISNYISAENGLIVTWFTPTTLINLELDSIVRGMVTECTVVVTTKVGASAFYGQTFTLIVSSDSEKIYFQFTRTGTIF